MYGQKLLPEYCRHCWCQDIGHKLFPTSLPSAAVGSPSVGGLRRFAAGSLQAQSPVHLEDEPFCRQRQVVVLGNRVPVLSPDVWVAPNAIIVGDVDLFDRVRPTFPPYLTLRVAFSLLGVLRNQSCAWEVLVGHAGEHMVRLYSERRPE